MLPLIQLFSCYKHLPFTSALGFSCPRSFKNLDTGCYYFSTDRMGWIEAKKTCEAMTPDGRLVSIESPAERDQLLKQVATQSRSRFEYWTAGNDIDTENNWVWAGYGGSAVPDFGWIDRPLPSAEENCLTWSIRDGLTNKFEPASLAESEYSYFAGNSNNAFRAYCRGILTQLWVMRLKYES
jgi:hypothetical protein